MSIGLYPIGLVPVGLTGELVEGTGGGDITAPILTLPTGENTGKYSAIGSVTTDENNGNLYYLTTTSPTATSTAVKAGGVQSVTVVGIQEITITGLAANTGYYNHYLHRDASGNDSLVSSSPQWFTAAEVAPVGTVTIGTISVGSTSASVPYTYSAEDALGFEYRLDGGAALNAPVNPISLSGLSPSTLYTIEVRATNAGGNGAWSNPTNFTTAAVSVDGTLTSNVFSNNTGQILSNLTGLTVYVYNKNTGVLVVSKSSETTNGSGICTITDASIVAATQYMVVFTNGTDYGIELLTAT